MAKIINKHNLSIDDFHNAEIVGPEIDNPIGKKQKKGQRKAALTASMDACTINGYVCEFGVYSGMSLEKISSVFDAQPVYGFDSFEGLPEEWLMNAQGMGWGKSEFALNALPAVRDNTVLVKGWFDQSLPNWIELHQGPMKFINIDCDLYSSTKTVLTLLNSQIVPGTVIQFDELYCWGNPSDYEFWEEHEYKALKEWLEEFDREVEILHRSRYFQAAIKVVK